MGFKVLICQGKGKLTKEVEVEETTLMFFDMLMAELNRVVEQAYTSQTDRQDHDYFEYFDEDGDAIAVRTDDELQSFLESSESDLQGEPQKIVLKSSRQEQKQLSQAAMNPSQIRPDDLQLLDRLSDGQFGTVYKALDVKNDRFVAVKSIAIGGMVGAMSRSSLLNEIEILKLACKSPYIVEFYSAIFTENELLICLELMDGLSLDLYGQLPSPVLGAVAVSVVLGLDYLWASHIIHRDIKPSNFLINTKGDVKLADFGVSKQMAQSVAWSYVGTKVYMAPERIHGDLYKIHSDVWSLGLSLLEMALGRFPEFPFKEILQLTVGTTAYIPNNTKPACNGGGAVENGFEELVSDCLKHNPLERPQPQQILQSPFIQLHTPPNTPMLALFVLNFTQPNKNESWVQGDNTKITL